MTVKGDDLVNLRSGPSPLNPVVGRAATGTTFVVLARSEHGEWLLLAYPDTPGGKAWVYTAYTDTILPSSPSRGYRPAARRITARTSDRNTNFSHLFNSTECHRNIAGFFRPASITIVLVETTDMINSPRVD